MKINFFTQTPNFKSTGRNYVAANGDEIGCNSWLFRDDLEWNKLAKYEAEHFKNRDKVNIVMFAAADGSEAYSKIISLYETFGEENRNKAEKFFPIMAYDIDNEILKAANSKLINTCLSDRLELQMKSENYENYFEETSQKLDIPNDITLQRQKTLKAKDILNGNVKFSYGDMFEKIKELKDNSNTILMCRNILGYFTNDKIEQFVKFVSTALKTGSLFAVGDHDSKLFDIQKCIEKAGFQKVLKNVYCKI